MEWRDEGLILGLRRHGEAAVILEVMTRDHGRHMGIVRSGRSRAMQPVLQPGNSVELVWRARLDEHMGTFAVEPLRQRAAAIMDSALALSAIAHLGQLLRFLPERDPHPPLFEALALIAEHLDDRDIAPALMVRFELEVLRELGFGVDLSACAATGAHEGLAYVSPKSGRAVSAQAGAPWADRLLPLPAFLLTGRAAGGAPMKDVLAGFRMTEYFLERDVLSPRGHAALDARRSFIAALSR